MPSKTGALTKDNPERLLRDSTIAELRLEGKTYRQIAEHTGLDFTRIGQILKQPEIEKRINQVKSYYIQHADYIGTRFLNLCLHDDPKISTANIKQFHKVTGITPAHTRIANFGTVNQDNRVQSANIQTILQHSKAQNASGDDSEVIDDAEYSNAGDEY